MASVIRRRLDRGQSGVSACHSCNQHKTNFANWAMVDIQSLVLGMPDTSASGEESVPDSLRRVPGWQRFALTSRTAHSLAQRESLTLKQAYYRIRSRVLLHPKVLRPGDVPIFPT